jgi:hypothetical protein
MAIQPAQNCLFPQDLDAATAALLQDLGDRFNSANADIQAIKNSAAAQAIPSLLEQGNLILNQLLQQGDGTSDLKTTTDLETQYGLEVANATPCQREQFLYYAGVLMVGGVLFVDGSLSPNSADADNIEVLRTIYYACGRDLTRMRKFLAYQRPLIFNNSFTIAQIPAADVNTPYTAAQIQRLLNLSYVPDIAYNPDNSAVALVSQFVAENQSLYQTSQQTGLPIENLVVVYVHYLQVDNSQANINKLTSWGYSGDTLNAILSDTNLIDLSDDPIQADIKSSQTLASSLVNAIDFVTQRLSVLTYVDSQNIIKNLQNKLNAIITAHNQTIAQSKFRVTTQLETNAFSQLDQYLSDEDLICLFEVRTEVKGIWFGASDQDKLNAINSPATPGSSSISNLYVNSQPTPPIDQTTLLQMASYLVQAQKGINTFTYNSLLTARQALVNFGASDPIPATSTNSTPLQGGVTMSTPADGIIQNMNFNDSFEIDAKLGAIDAALSTLGNFLESTIAGPLASVINILVGIIKAAYAACDTLEASLRAAILPLKQQVDSFTSKYLTLVGSGTFNSSLLKCAINFNIGVSAPILDDLLGIIDQLSQAIQNLISQFANLIDKMLENILCLPINLLNSFLGSVSANLPSVCQAPKVNLGNPLETALTNLRNASMYRNQVYYNYSRDLLTYHALVTNAPEILQQFNSSSVCNTKGTNQFYNTAMLNIGGGIKSPF